MSRGSKKHGIPSGNTRRDWENAYWEAQGGMCSICAEPLLREAQGLTCKEGWSFDHVFPRAIYGRRYMHSGNLLLAHIGCNNESHDAEPSGCEIILLHGVKALLGKELRERAPEGERQPSAIELAWRAHVKQRAQAA
jgi:hypothetical protein